MKVKSKSSFQQSDEYRKKKWKKKEPVVHKDIENRTEKIKDLKQTTPMDIDKFSFIFNLRTK